MDALLEDLLTFPHSEVNAWGNPRLVWLPWLLPLPVESAEAILSGQRSNSSERATIAMSYIHFLPRSE
jgi:hypothetical protein